jgi:hypothetical protein
VPLCHDVQVGEYPTLVQDAGFVDLAQVGSYQAGLLLL